jgi:hypothetical protein
MHLVDCAAGDMNQINPIIDGYVTAQECLETLFPNKSLSLRSFRKLQAEGYIPFLKLGARTLFCPSEVRSALEKRCKRRAMAI